MMESSHIQFGKTRIDYEVVRSSRRRTVAVAVDPADGVLLRAPKDVPISRLDDVVHDKARWIVARLYQVGQPEQRLPKREFVSGESFPYLGRHYRLKVRTRSIGGEVKLERGHLVVIASRGLEGTHKAHEVRASLTHWYREHATRRLVERVSLNHERVGVEMPEVLIRNQAKRWGSCDQTGTLRFNWRIVQAPMSMVDYVVVHELVHLVHRDHTKAFWARVGRVMPDYDARREKLRLMGRRLEW